MRTWMPVPVFDTSPRADGLVDEQLHALTRCITRAHPSHPRIFTCEPAMHKVNRRSQG